MQGNHEVIKILNEVLAAEITAINQYFVHAKWVKTGDTGSCTNLMKKIL